MLPNEDIRRDTSRRYNEETSRRDRETSDSWRNRDDRDRSFSQRDRDNQGYSSSQYDRDTSRRDYREAPEFDSRYDDRRQEYGNVASRRSYYEDDMRRAVRDRDYGAEDPRSRWENEGGRTGSRNTSSRPFMGSGGISDTYPHDREGWNPNSSSGQSRQYGAQENSQYGSQFGSPNSSSYGGGNDRERYDRGTTGGYGGYASGQTQGAYGGGRTGATRSTPDYRSDWNVGATETHRGKGPKGYQRTDARIQEEISERLAMDDDVDATGIDVAVKDGEVTLTGSISDRECRRRVEDIAEGILGVKHVNCSLRIDRSHGSSNSGSSGANASGRNAGANTSSSTQNSAQTTNAQSSNNPTASAGNRTK